MRITSMLLRNAFTLIPHRFQPHPFQPSPSSLKPSREPLAVFTCPSFIPSTFSSAFPSKLTFGFALEREARRFLPEGEVGSSAVALCARSVSLSSRISILPEPSGSNVWKRFAASF